MREIWGSFSARVFLYLMAAMLSLNLIFYFVFISSQQRIIYNHMGKEGQTMTQLLADNIRIGVFSENMALIANSVDSVLRQDNVMEVMVTGQDGKVLLQNQNSAGAGRCNDKLATRRALLETEMKNGAPSTVHDTGECLIFGTPILIAAKQPTEEHLYFDNEYDTGQTTNKRGKNIGFVAISFDKQGLSKSRQRLLFEHGTILVIFFILALVITFLITRHTMRPIIRLIDMVKSSDMHVEAADQIGLLRKSYSSLIDRLSDSFRTITKLKLDLENLTRELLKTQEEERQRLAFDLHDDVAQELSSLRISCDTLLDEWPQAPEEVRRKRDAISQLLKKCVVTVRGLSYDLQPPDLEQLGLAQATFRLCDDFASENNLELDFMVNGFDHYEPDYNTAINCYRIVQEALNNIKKHANAGRIEIRLVANFPSIILRISDDGIGFDPDNRLAEAASEHRMGLKSMEKRASLLNGQLKLQSSPGNGTRIFIKLPYNAYPTTPISEDCLDR